MSLSELLQIRENLAIRILTRTGQYTIITQCGGIRSGCQFPGRVLRMCLLDWFSVTYAAARTSAGEVRENTEQIDKTRFIMEVT